jgi:hypothetical protein
MCMQKRVATSEASRLVVIDGNTSLCQLSDDLLMHILKYLSAADLTRCACTCRRLQEVASHESFWRRLYCFRWGFFKGGEAKVPHAHFWKVYPCWCWNLVWMGPVTLGGQCVTFHKVSCCSHPCLETNFHCFVVWLRLPVCRWEGEALVRCRQRTCSEMKGR